MNFLANGWGLAVCSVPLALFLLFLIVGGFLFSGGGRSGERLAGLSYNGKVILVFVTLPALVSFIFNVIRYAKQ